MLGPEDTTSLMKSITPERNQQELQEVGGTDFGFAYGDKARFRVAVFKQRGHIGMVLRQIPREFLTFEQLGLPMVIRDVITAASRAVSRDGSHGKRQDDQPGQHDQLDESTPSTTTSSRSKTRSSTTTRTKNR